MGNQRIRTCDVKLVKIHLPKKRKQNDESKANKKFKFGDEEYFVNWNISPKKQNSSFQCQVCNKGFKDGTALLYHQIYHPQPVAVSPSLRQFAVPDETASRLSGEGIINKSPAIKGGSLNSKRVRVKSSLDNSIPRIRDNFKNNELTGSSTATTPPASPKLSAGKRNLRLRISKQSNASWKVDDSAADSQVNKDRRNNKTDTASESDTPRRPSSTDSDSGCSLKVENEEPEVLSYGTGKRPRWNLFGTVRTPTSVWRKQKRKSNPRSQQGKTPSDTTPISDKYNKKSGRNNLNNSQVNSIPKQVCDTKTKVTVTDKDVICDEHENTKDDPVIEKSSVQSDPVSLDKHNKEQVQVKKNDTKLDRKLDPNATPIKVQNDDNISATNSDNEPCKEIHDNESFPEIDSTLSEINVTSNKSLHENNINETKCSQDESFINDVEEINGSLSSNNHSTTDITVESTNGLAENVCSSNVIEIENDDFDDDFCCLPSSAPLSSPNYVNNLLKPINMSDSDLDEIQAVCEKVNSGGASPCLLASSPSKPLSRTFPNLLENNNSDISLILEKFDGSSIPGIFENGQETPEVVAMCSSSSNSTNIDVFPQILEDDIANFGFQSAAGVNIFQQNFF